MLTCVNVVTPQICIFFSLIVLINITPGVKSLDLKN